MQGDSQKSITRKDGKFMIGREKIDINKSNKILSVNSTINKD